MPTKTKTPLYRLANDLGYSSMKVDLNDQKYHIPSVIAIQRPQNYTKPEEFDSQADQDYYYQHLLDHMDVTVNSPAVGLQGRFLIGQRALDSGLPTRAFDVNDFSGKSQSDLALILTLATLANQAVSDAYQKGQNLSELINIDVLMSTALPITEGKTNGVTEKYQDRYLKGKHMVSLYNFGQPINVQITFKNVYVGFEGEMAQLEIANADDQLKTQIQQDFEHSYPDFQEEVTGDDLIQLQNVLGIDIGEGTTDFAVITNGKANANASNSLENGYGNVLQDAVSILQHEGVNVSTRNQLSDFLHKQVSVLARNRQNHAKQVVADQLNQLVDQIIDATSETMRHAGTNIELVYVYGGGSVPLLADTDMRERLVNKLKGFAGGFDIPVIWIDPSRAQTLNEDGLKLVVDHLDA